MTLQLIRKRRMVDPAAVEKNEGRHMALGSQRNIERNELDLAFFIRI